MALGVDVQATGDGLVIGEGKTAGDNGEVTRTVIATSADDQGLITLVVSVGDAVIGQRNFEVGAMVDAAPVTVDAFAPAIAAAGQTFTSYSGGTVAELMAALAAAGATSATVTLADGSTVTVIVTPLAFVNADFNAAFSNGVPAGTNPGSAVAQLRANIRRASRWLRPPGRPRRGLGVLNDLYA